MSVNHEHCDVVEVHWVDSCGFDGAWVDNDELESLKPKEIATVGHLVVERDESIVVAPTIGDEQNFGSMCIPYCAIRSVERIQKSDSPVSFTGLVSERRKARYPHVILAVENGEDVQCRRSGTIGWTDWEKHGGVTFLHPGFDWRVKPKESRDD
jgi:hypothetical protein